MAVPIDVPAFGDFAIGSPTNLMRSGKYNGSEPADGIRCHKDTFFLDTPLIFSAFFGRKEQQSTITHRNACRPE